MVSIDFEDIIFILVVSAVLIACFSIPYEIHKAIYSNAKKHVLKNSIKLKQLDLLNEKYFFHLLPTPNSCEIYQKSITAFRRFNYEDALLTVVRRDLELFEDYIQKAAENSSNYNEYIKDFNRICEAHKTSWNSRLKDRIESELISNKKLHPICYVNIKIENRYISPKGQSVHYDSRVFSQEDIVKAFAKIQQQNTFESQKRSERSKMSDSLRYDILQRDGFRCTLCGASQSDGVTLHVDHIRPVSKGGKTEPSNLRTLCSRCNFGKSDKYDPNGVN